MRDGQANLNAQIRICRAKEDSEHKSEAERNRSEFWQYAVRGNERFERFSFHKLPRKKNIFYKYYK